MQNENELIKEYKIEVQKNKTELNESYSAYYKAEEFSKYLSISFCSTYTSTYQNVVEFYLRNNRKLPELDNFIIIGSYIESREQVTFYHKSLPNIPIIYFTLKETGGNKFIELNGLSGKALVEQLTADLDKFLLLIHSEKKILNNSLYSTIIEEIVPESIKQDTLEKAISHGMNMLLTSFLRTMRMEKWSGSVGVIDNHQDYISVTINLIIKEFLSKSKE